jgi:hypothetical protein
VFVGSVDPDKIYKSFSKTLLKFEKTLHHIMKLTLVTPTSFFAKFAGARSCLK